ncbi:MAG: hypothetical protein K9H25_14395 [Rhodospirillum sp.]|nr:hypothetical protein [Rhodospirillum sp.]MCF8491750.1 hypothetical protein [Rhodospirillum sp.]
MMGISLGKLIFTLVVVVGVWTLFKAIARRGGKTHVSPAQRAARKAEETVRARMGGRGGDRGGGEAMDLVRCPSCGAFTAEGSTCQCGWKAPG